MSMERDREELFVAERAIEWLERLETAGPEERAEFWKWLTESPLHVREMLVSKACHTMLTHLFRDRRIDIDTFMSRATNVREIGSRTAASVTRAERAKVERPAARSSPWKVAAVIAFMAVLTLVAVGIEAVSDRSVVTGPSEWRTTELPDGTVLRSGPRTKVSVAFTDRQRIVRLARGEAMFHVAKDPTRPFLVETDLATARAVGTVFAVSRVDLDGVVVTVDEGVVAVARRASDQTAMNGDISSTTLRAGDQIRVTKALPLAIKHVDVQKELAWVEGRLEFDRVTVEQAVHQFNLRNRKQIKIANPVIAQRAVAGSFRAADPESFVAALEDYGLVSVVVDKRGTLLLVPHTGAAAP